MSERNDLPLDGVRVIDLSSTIAGPAATRHMSDFGAQVIKIETRRRPDIARRAPPQRHAPDPLDQSGYFSAYNAGKLSLSLDLARPGAHDVLRRLVEKSDVLVEAFRPGVMEGLGLPPAVIQGWNPNLILARHSLQGQTGPRSGLRGFGHLAAAATGWFDVTGPSDGPPVGPFSAYTDFLAWPVLLTAILVALEEREITGCGSLIDHAHVDTSAYFAAPELLAAQRGKEPVRDGCHDLGRCPNNVYPCSGQDEWCAITVASDREWLLLIAALGLEEKAELPISAGVAARKKKEAQIDAAIAARTCTMTCDALQTLLVDIGIAAVRVYRAQDLFDDPQLAARGVFRQLDHPGHGRHAVLGHSFRFDRLDAGPHRAFPTLGADSDNICRDILGMDEDELADLHDTGVLS